MTFNMNRAWDEAVRMLKANKELVLILAGLFFFLPVLALGILRPETLVSPAFPTDEQSMQAYLAYYERNGTWINVVQVVQLVGMLGLFALFTHRRPTVGKAIQAAVKAFLPFIIAVLFVLLAFSLLGGSVLGLTLTISDILARILAFFIAVLLFFVIARLSPLMPLLVDERRLNPFSALVDSWRLTAGRGWRILGFLLLILVAILVVTLLVNGVISLVTALIGSPEAANFIAAALNALFSALFTCVILAVVMAIYRQLNAPASAAGVPRTHSDAE